MQRDEKKNVTSTEMTKIPDVNDFYGTEGISRNQENRNGSVKEHLECAFQTPDAQASPSLTGENTEKDLGNFLQLINAGFKSAIESIIVKVIMIPIHGRSYSQLPPSYLKSFSVRNLAYQFGFRDNHPTIQKVGSQS